MSWPVGTIVVCVDARPNSNPRVNALAPEWVVEGAYYTIREHGLDAAGLMHVKLNEIVCRVNPDWGVEQGWSASRFRRAESSHSEAGSVRQQEPVSA